jgi:hypothetical protein
MIKTNQVITESVTVKAHDQKYWEKRGVKFAKSKCISMSLSGVFGEERDSWTAYYKKKYLSGGGSTIESVVAWINKKQDKYLQIMKTIDSGKYI